MKIVSTFRPAIVHTRAEIAAGLTELRRAAGMTGEELDDHIGWSDRYTAKLENGGMPYGKQGVIITPQRITMSPIAEVWLEALGVA